MHQPPQNSTTRFSDRVDNYVRFRPSYPPAVLDILGDETNFTSSSVVADVGSGTGISSELFLKNGNEVYGIEPNNEMRQAAERLLASYPAFHSIAAQAEATTLPDASIDYVVAGQAFHWFDRARTKQEFARILKADGWVVLLWNSRRLDSSPFLREYEALLQNYGTDYRDIEHKQIDADILRSFFARGQFVARQLFNEQRFDFDGLKGRLLSSSYAPPENHANFQPMIRELERVFHSHNQANEVCFEYDTEIYFGHIT